MSIAVSAIVRPSRLLLAMTSFVAGLVAAISILVCVGYVGDASLGLRLSVGPATFFLALFGFYHGIRSRKTIQLDISGTGLIRVAEIDPGGACMDTNWPHVGSSGEAVRLMKNSTLWPNLLLLRLHSNQGTITVPILPDSLPKDSFRALSVACRWIAAQKNSPDIENF